MDNLQEALFKAMLNSGWFTQSDGDVESPVGYFGYVVNDTGDWGGDFDGVYEEFRDVIDAYSSDELDDENVDKWLAENFYGVYSAWIDSNGIIHIHRHGDYVRTNTAVLGIEPTLIVREAMERYNTTVRDYVDWNNENEDEDGDAE